VFLLRDVIGFYYWPLVILVRNFMGLSCGKETLQGAKIFDSGWHYHYDGGGRDLVD
jgi:hypothetical protein